MHKRVGFFAKTIEKSLPHFQVGPSLTNQALLLQQQTNPSEANFIYFS